MRLNRLGNTGLLVSELCLGTMTFGGGGVWDAIGAVQQADAEALIGRALDAGINFIDTANVYSDGQAEVITGQALRNLGIARDDVIIATKVFGPTGSGPNAQGASRSHILAGVKASLKRLQLDHIDLYQIHGFDAVTPVEETIRALETIVQQGLVRYVGVSNWSAWQVMKALGVADRLGFARLASVQAYYSVAGRDTEREIVPLVQSEGLGLLAWSPLAGGLLSGKLSDGGAAAEGSRRAAMDFPPVDRPRATAVIDVMRPIARDHGVSIAQIALAWLLYRPQVTSVTIGVKRVEQLDDNIGATTVQLSSEDLRRLDEVSRLPMEYPGWMMASWGATRQQQLDATKAPRVGTS
jgi:aryl-alcohol dehydrogenase-like predicted oxidoreductase